MRERKTWQKQLAAVRQTAAQVRRRIGREGPLLDAYLYVARVRCGRATCQCMRTDRGHTTWCLSFRDHGRSRTVTVPAAWRRRLATATGDYREARGLLRALPAQARAAAAAAAARLAVRVKVGRQLLAALLAAKAASQPRRRTRR